MTAINDDDISNAELLEAVNNGFTRMQEQFDSLKATEARHHGENQQHHSENQQEHAEIHEEIAAFSKKLDQTVVVTDTHDRILQTLKR